MNSRWFALQVHTGREKWIGAYLASGEFEQLVLLQKDIREWSDRRKNIDVPIFPGYVFCHFDLQVRSRVLLTPGVQRIVGNGWTPIAIEDEEIAALQLLQKASCPIERWPYLREGDLMRIDGGALDGLVGRFVRAKSGCRIVVSVTLLQRSVSVEIDPSRLTPVKNGDRMQYTAHAR